jgi:hypothetical protein
METYHFDISRKDAKGTRKDRKVLLRTKPCQSFELWQG